MADNKINNSINAEVKDELSKRKSVWGFFQNILPKPNSKKGERLYGQDMSKGTTEPLINQYDFEAISKVIQDAIGEKDARNINLNHSALSSMDFAPIFRSKKSKISVYKKMYLYPEINSATNIIVNEAIVTDDAGETLRLVIKDNGGNELPIALQEIFKASMDMLLIDIFDLDKVIQDLFLKFLIEGELYVEYVMNEDATAIVDYQVLPSYSMIPIFKDGTSTIIGYAQFEDIIMNCESESDVMQAFRGSGGSYDAVMGTHHSVWLDDGVHGIKERSGYNEFLPNEIGYANFGTYGTSEYDVIGYFETVRKTYNQMSTIDDALAVYRFVRAPETRLWNIFTGSLPPGRADAYLQNVISEFRKEFNYNSETGEIEQDTVFKSIIDDYFFATDGAGNKTTVDTLSGAMNLDQLKDYDNYKDKLMTGLQIPRGRWDKEAMREWTTRSESVTGEEVQLSYFIERLQKNFVQIFKTGFENVLRLNGVDEKYIDSRYYSLEFAKRNHWKYWQDVEQWTSKLEMYKAMEELIYDPENNPFGQFTPDFAMKKAFNFSAQDEQALAESMEEWKKKFEEKKTKPEIESWNPGDKQPNIGYNFGESNKIYDFGNFSDSPYKFGESELEQKEFALYQFGKEILESAPDEVTIETDNFEDIIYDGEDTYSEQEVYHFGMDEVTYDYGSDESEEDKYSFGNPYLYGNDNIKLQPDEAPKAIKIKHEPAERVWSHPEDEDSEDIKVYNFKENPEPEFDDNEAEVFVMYDFDKKNQNDEVTKSDFLPEDEDYDKYDNTNRTYNFGEDSESKYSFGESEEELF